MEIPRGWRVGSQKPTFLIESLKRNWNFQRRASNKKTIKNKNPSVPGGGGDGGIDNFWTYTIKHFIHTVQPGSSYTK